MFSPGLRALNRGIQLGCPGYHPISMKAVEKKVKRLFLVTALFVFSLLLSTARAQQIDVAFGYGTLTAPAGKTSGAFFFPSMGGGGYPSFTAVFLLKHRLVFDG